MTKSLLFCHNPQFHSALLVMYRNENLASTKRIWLYFAVFVSLVIAGLLMFQPSVSPVAYEAIETPPHELFELPVRLMIPAIGVDAKVQYVGLEPGGTGEMDVPSNFTDVGWYQPGVRPGMQGSAVIAGHYNGKEVREAVFFDLDKLQVGDEVVIINAEKIENIFRVVKVETYDHDAPTAEVFLSNDGKARLNLITCSGDWLSAEESYNKRTVVYTELLTSVE